MLRSKFHRPWQPRISDSQQFNPFAHTNESESSFRDELEEVEAEIHTDGPEAAAASGRNATRQTEALSSRATAAPKSKQGWYASLVEKLISH